MGRSGKQHKHLGDENATELATGRQSFDEDGHVEVQWLVSLADGNLPNELQSDVLAHLSGCERCRQVVAQLGQDATVRHETQQAPTINELPAADLVGQLVGEYQVLEKLSEGGMGVVYRGVQPMIGKSVAVKVLQPEFARDEGFSHRLLAEARAVNAIRHPNIVDVFAFGALPDGRQYFVMELLAGQSVSTLIRGGPLELIDVVVVLEQGMSALTAAHAAGVVHRDVKPSNIFVTPLADGLHVTVLDFGVAKGVEKPLGDAVTLPGSIIGTPGFMAPEQIRGVLVGPPADVYAMGCVAFLLLTGREVFRAEANIDLFRLHLTAPRPALTTLVSVPQALSDLVEAMLAVEAGARPEAAEVKRKLTRLRKDLTPAAASKRVKKDEPTLPVRPAAKQRDARTEPSQPAIAPLTERDLPAVAASAATLPVVRSRKPWAMLLLVLMVGAAVVWRFVLH